MSMICPKCGFEQEEANECVRCGIVIAKYQESQERDQEQIRPRAGRRRGYYLRRVLLLCLVLFAVSYYMKGILPPVSELVEQLNTPPLQGKTGILEFTVQVGNEIYSIEPRFSYELYGLIVSANSPVGFFETRNLDTRFHIKDIGVIWGANALKGLYRKLTFSNDGQECVYKGDSLDTKDFSPASLSHNHLVTDKQKLKKIITGAQPGDQIFLKGFLADYTRKDTDVVKKTSIKRSDEGTGAGEVIYLTDFIILKKGRPFWRMVNTVSLVLIFILGLAQVVQLFRKPRHDLWEE